jgi:hypothetical protein
MRTSTRVRNALVAIVSATALTGGALAVAAAPASAATGSGSGYGCHGYGCIGKYPQVQGCSSDASTVYAISVYDGLRKTRVTLRLRYSAGCQSEWATVTDTGRPDGVTGVPMRSRSRRPSARRSPSNGRRAGWSAWPRPRRRRASRCAGRTG